MYLACFLRLWMTSESALGAQTIILWHLRESGPEKQTTNNKKVPWQNTFAMFVFHYWCNPVVFLFLDQWKKKILGFLKQLSHILWEYWNTRLYKQTGNGQCGGGSMGRVSWLSFLKLREGMVCIWGASMLWGMLVVILWHPDAWTLAPIIAVSEAYYVKLITARNVFLKFFHPP